MTPGDRVDGRFELIERLGSGGMGTVWRARDTVLHREVALKAVRQDTDASHTVRERVMREARALARLSDPHVVTVYEVIEAEPHPWIVMELVPGTSLQQRIAAGPLSPAETARIGRQLLSALRAAHAAGIQHRDVKPANILIRPNGTAALTDFGIAALQGATALTASGELIGTPEYMAPERIRGRDDDPASDLWSLGLVLYVCTEGASPLRRATTLATLAAVLDEPVPPPVRSGPLAPVLQSLLVRDPAARPDAGQLDAMLAEVEAGTAPCWAQPTMTAARMPTPVLQAPPTQQDVPKPGRPTRSRTTVFLAATAVLAVTTATALVVTFHAHEDNKPTAGPAGATPTARPTPTSLTPAPHTRPATPLPGHNPDPTPTPSPSSSPTPSGSQQSSAPADSGRWIAQLSSEPVSSGTAARDQHLHRIRTSVPEALYLRSDDYASLRPGYWVIYAPGPFADGRAALTFCAERGRTTANACIGRYLSTSPADFTLQCYPPAPEAKGGCTRNGS
ncbi:serine/threonine-protein kinase [Streptomyces sp. MUM 16J]|uniref:serine/threonine-protein kinase n=1 Tax=Streptomyces sp. MUM 16J TaxID=2791988 RepID=UPI001F03403B|nr:serine/threonine-protein kinase [Streptomyces sp. MUM 16J]MCH0557640.1 serine/threonine protein kinase [Streptomyces sp. MUM 16J]